MLTCNTDQFRAVIKAHAAADLLVRNGYDAETGEGGFVGCLAHGDDAVLIESTYGLPQMLTRVLESIFERLPKQEARQFFLNIGNAMPGDGVDLGRVVWQFLAAELRAIPPQPAAVQAVIDPVIAGMDLLANGREWPDAADAADAAYAAASAYAADAARAATAAASAYAADAARAAAYAAYAVAARAAVAAYAARAAVAARQAKFILTLMEATRC